MDKKQVAFAVAKAVAILSAVAYLDETNIVATIAKKAIALIGQAGAVLGF